MSARIPLSGRYAIGGYRFAIVDAEDYARLARWKWKAKPNAAKTHVYAVRNVCVQGVNQTLRMHRVILGLAPGDARECDHINGNPLDNRRSNLRAVTRAVNARNTAAKREREARQCKLF